MGMSAKGKDKKRGKQAAAGSTIARRQSKTAKGGKTGPFIKKGLIEPLLYLQKRANRVKTKEDLKSVFRGGVNNCCLEAEEDRAEAKQGDLSTPNMRSLPSTAARQKGALSR